MKKLEIKEINIKSAFKTTLYLTSIPLGIMFIFSLFTIIIGAAAGAPKMLVGSIPFLIMPVFMFIVYGLISMLAALVYNVFSKKFGGLQIKVDEADEEIGY